MMLLLTHMEALELSDSCVANISRASRGQEAHFGIQKPV